MALADSSKLMPMVRSKRVPGVEGVEDRRNNEVEGVVMVESKKLVLLLPKLLGDRKSREEGRVRDVGAVRSAI